MAVHYRGIAALALGLALAGCLQTTTPPPSANRSDLRSSAGPTKSAPALLHLSTSVELSSRTVTGGDVSAIVVSVTNDERESVTLRFADTCQLLHAVYDRHGNEVPQQWGCFYVPTSLTIGPGETVRQQRWLFTSRWDDRLHAYVPLPPGPYRVHAYLKRYGYSSPPAIVRIVP